MRRARRAAARLALVLAALLAADGLCRVAFLRLHPGRYYEAGSSTWWRLRWRRALEGRAGPPSPGQGAVEPELVYDPQLGWTARPLLRGLPTGTQGGRISTDSRGARGMAEHALGCAAKRRPRVLVLGDSFAFGDEVNDDEVFPARLQRLLPGVEFIDLGVGGYGHDQMTLRYERDGRAYCADAVLLCYVDADRKRNLLSFRDYAKPRFSLSSGGALRLTGTPVPPPARELRRERRRPLLFELFALAWDAWRPRPDPTAAILDRLRADVARDGARFGAFEAGAPGWLAGYCRSRGLDCATLGSDTRPEDGYGHWSPREHALAARALVPYLRRLLGRKPAA